MINPSENENEKILDRIIFLKEEIWETKSYISSDFCLRCSEMYDKIAVLEKELKKLEQQISNDNSQN